MNTTSGFRLSEELFVSGSTRVCRATQLADGQPVVLKILNGEEVRAEDFAQYRREYELTQTLGDIAGVIKVYGLKNIQDTLMIVEEDIGGVSLADILGTEKIGVAEALELAVRLARTLDQIHQRYVIHKDINPANMVWNRATGELRIIDFGIASKLGQERQEFQNVNQLEGSLAYISPEQTGRVNRVLDYRSDLYSLGVSLYQLFTGTLPFDSRQGIELVHAHIAVTPRPPHELNPEIPRTLSQIVMRLMSKMADDRYQSARGLEHDLQRCFDQMRTTGNVADFPLAESDHSLRFHIPQKLYGRNREIASIIAAFERTSGGAGELLLVGGGAGTGKTALVHEVHRPLTEKHGSFVAGKFDQYQRDIPFYAWTQALEQFCNLLLKEDEVSLARWRERILTALGSIGKVVTNLIPSIGLIVGEQPDVPRLEGEQALNRLNYAFGNFLAAICLKDHPLVVFLDDWQWADAGSLSLLKSVTGRADCRHLLLIGAYRDNEVHPAHPFAMALNEIRKSGSIVGTINLQGLQHDDVRQLVGETLDNPPDVDDFARLVYEKTLGNAFFLVQLLTDLFEKELIRFDPDRQHWSWLREQIAARGIADNVVELMAGKIRQLPAATQSALINASCIGDHFDLLTLATIQRQPPHETADTLEPALQEGILLPIGTGYRIAGQPDNTGNASYHFVHDRVRQAAYGLLDADTAAKNHFDIAHIWLTELDATEQESRIFDIANQLNAGLPLVVDAPQKNRLLGINLLAGKRAKNATAYVSALSYLKSALDLLAPDSWQTQAETNAELYLLTAEVAFLVKDYALMESAIDEYLNHVAAPLDRIKAFRIRVQAYVAQNRLSEAVDVALHGLGLLGIQLPKSPTGEDVVAQLTATKTALAGKSIGDLLALPAMTDPTQLAVMDLLGLALPPAYWTSQELLALTVFQMVRVTVAHGYSPNAGYGFSWWGIIECALLGNIDEGCQFGEFAIDLARLRHLNLQQPLFFAAWIIRKFKYPLKDTIPVFEQTYALSLEIGDFEYASYARNNYIQALFHTGQDLFHLLPEMEQANRDLQRFQIGSSLYWHNLCWQTCLNFAEPIADPQSLAGRGYDEATSLPQHLKANDVSSLFLLYFAKLLLSCFFNRPAQALDNAEKARSYLKGGVGMHAFILFHFYESLALLGSYEGSNQSGRRRVLKAVMENQKLLKNWADHAPMNYRHHWLLIEAETLRARGKADKATHVFDQAIDKARENGFVHEEALANERAARCHLQRGQERLAAFYLMQTLRLYERWGASAKAAHLKAEYPQQFLTLTPPGGSPQTTRSTTTIRSGNSGNLRTEAFDIAAITAASQAISSEIVVDNLITTLLQIVIENSGAQKAFLILINGDEISIEAEGSAGDSIIVTVQHVILDEDENLPLARSIVQYVARTATAVVIHDARQESWYSRDPYVVRVSPLSILCQPIIQQGKLIGVLYLENNLTVGAFTAQRLELLRLLASQAAISLENANLYRSLERKVEIRTQKLQASLKIQQQLNAELTLSEQQLRTAEEKLRKANALLQMRADTDGLTGLANRRAFDERLRYELNRCARDEQPLTLILCDLDNFKRYNDSYGHVAGDDCLKQAALALQTGFSRAIDLVARYGGEEFVVLLPMTTPQQAALHGEAIREAIAALKIEHTGNAQHGIITISVGCHSMVPNSSTDATAVIERADAALYQAKHQGRNCVVLLD